MKRRTFRTRATAATLLTLGLGTMVCAQEIQPPKTPIAGEALPGTALPDATSWTALLPSAPFPDSVSQESAKTNAAAPCLEPPPLLSWKDYQGPFQKVVGAFARKLNLKSVHLNSWGRVQRGIGSIIQPGPHVRTRRGGLWETLWRRFCPPDNVEVFHRFRVSDNLLGRPSILPPDSPQRPAAFPPCN